MTDLTPASQIHSKWGELSRKINGLTIVESRKVIIVFIKLVIAWGSFLAPVQLVPLSGNNFTDFPRKGSLERQLYTSRSKAYKKIDSHFSGFRNATLTTINIERSRF